MELRHAVCQFRQMDLCMCPVFGNGHLNRSAVVVLRAADRPIPADQVDRIIRPGIDPFAQPSVHTGFRFTVESQFREGDLHLDGIAVIADDPAAGPDRPETALPFIGIGFKQPFGEADQ